MPIDTAHPLPVTNRPETVIAAWIYIGIASDGRGKIGITKTPDRRRRQIEHAAGLHFVRFVARWCYAPGAAERCVLRRWAASRIQDSEWLAPGVADEVLAYLVPRTAAAPPEPLGSPL